MFVLLYTTAGVEKLVKFLQKLRLLFRHLARVSFEKELCCETIENKVKRLGRVPRSQMHGDVKSMTVNDRCGKFFFLLASLRQPQSLLQDAR